MVFELLDLKPRNPYLSLAMDEALCRYYSKQEGFKGGVRLWANNYSVILGRSCDPHANLQPDFVEKARASHVKSDWSSGANLCRRASGGGTVLHGPGSINFSIFVPLELYPNLFPVKESYRVILGLISDSLSRLGIETRLEGQSDLVLTHENGDVRKISGNAQFRKHGILMHHGTLITHRDLLEFITKFLRHPPQEPDYREGRNHEEFLGYLPDSFDISAFYTSLTALMRKFLNTPELKVPSRDQKKEIFGLARQLAYDVYSQEEWILDGRYPGRK